MRLDLICDLGIAIFIAVFLAIAVNHRCTRHNGAEQAAPAPAPALPLHDDDGGTICWFVELMEPSDIPGVGAIAPRTLACVRTGPLYIPEEGVLLE
jgi:hypothetical protein